MKWLERFVAESNRIEGIPRVRQEEYDAHAAFITAGSITVKDLQTFVDVVQPGAVLRARKGLNVRVGSHIAPPGSREITPRLEELLAFLPHSTPYQNHVAYETLHPFTDGNGRSGRALWLWQMLNVGTERDRIWAIELGFLNSFYFQTLQATNRVKEPHNG